MNEPSIKELSEVEDIAIAITARNLRICVADELIMSHPQEDTCTHSGNPEFVFPGGSFDGRVVPRVKGLTRETRWCRNHRRGNDVFGRVTTESPGFCARSFPSENDATAASEERTRPWTCNKDIFPDS